MRVRTANEANKYEHLYANLGEHDTNTFAEKKAYLEVDLLSSLKVLKFAAMFANIFADKFAEIPSLFVRQKSQNALFVRIKNWIVRRNLHSKL